MKIVHQCSSCSCFCLNKERNTDDIFHFDYMQIVALLDSFIELVHEIKGRVELVGKVLLLAL